MTDGLKDRHREAIIAKIAANDRVERAVLFGSRATGTNTVSSDVDIALFGDRLTLTDQARITAALDEIPMAQSVDLLLYDSIQDRTLREHIGSYGVEWYTRPTGHGVRSTLPRAAKGNSGRSSLCLDDLAIVVMGQSPSGETVSKGEGVALLNGPTEFGPHHPHPVQFTTDPRRYAQPGDLLFCVRGSTTGRMNWADRRYAIGRGVAAIRHRHDLGLQSFVRAVIEFELPELLAHATGSTFPNVSASQLAQIPCPSFTQDEQRAIAHVLGTLDDKIDLNRRINATLEAMARALFRSWFVDFDPVRAKMEGRDTGLPKDIAALFPGRLVDSELGKVPEGWTVGTLGDIALSPRRGVDPVRVAVDTPYIGLEHMPRKSVALTDWGRAESVSSNKSAFESGDILFGKLRPYFHKVGIAPVNGVCSTDIVVLHARTPGWSAFTLVCVSSPDFVGYASQTATGTKMPRTSWLTMSGYELCQPTDAIATEFHRVVSPLLERIVANVHESRTLGLVRDMLLPKLVSGELRMNAAEPVFARDDRPASVGANGA